MQELNSMFHPETDIFSDKDQTKQIPLKKFLDSYTRILMYLLNYILTILKILISLKKKSRLPAIYILDI